MALVLGTVAGEGGRRSAAQAPEAPSPSLAIDINSSDIKALYRRCQALEHLGKLDQAFKDVQRCATLEPRNQNFQETLRRLNTSIQEKVSRTPTHKPWLPPPTPSGRVREAGHQSRSNPTSTLLGGVNAWHRQVPENSRAEAPICE